MQEVQTTDSSTKSKVHQMQRYLPRGCAKNYKNYSIIKAEEVLITCCMRSVSIAEDNECVVLKRNELKQIIEEAVSSKLNSIIGRNKEET